jgi:hypothetical protein
LSPDERHVKEGEMAEDRRGFLKTVGGVTAALAASAARPGRAEAAGAAAGASRFLLEVDGIPSGYLKSFGGGTAAADVVAIENAGEGFVRKGLGRVRNRSLSVQADLGSVLGTPLFGWVAAACALDHSRHDGVVRTLSYNYKELRLNRFEDALITEVQFPKLDAAGKDPAALGVTIAPESVEFDRGSGSSVGTTNPKAKVILESHFRLTIPGLEEACTRATRIEALTVTHRVTEYSEGGSCAPAALLTGVVEVSDLVVSFDETKAEKVYQWYEEAVLGSCGSPAAPRQARLELLGSSQQTLLTVNLAGVGIYELTPTASNANAETTAQVTAKMYCERLSLSA